MLTKYDTPISSLGIHAKERPNQMHQFDMFMCCVGVDQLTAVIHIKNHYK